MMEGGSKDKDEQKNVVWGELDPDEVQLLVRTRRAYDARGEVLCAVPFSEYLSRSDE